MPNEPQAQPQTNSAQDNSSAVAVGGPGLENAPAGNPVTESGVQINIGGRQFTVDPTLAQAYGQRETEFSRKLNENSTELGEWRTGKRALQTTQPQPTPQPQAPAAEDLSTLVFTDPQRAFAMHEQQIMAKISQAYQADQQQRQFWTDFYKEATDLDPMQDDMLVRMIMQKNYAELNALPISQARGRLADLTRTEILRYTQKQPTNPGGPIVEPASHPAGLPPVAPQPPQPKSMSELIKARQAQARATRRPAPPA